MRGIGARKKAVAQHRLGYFQQFHQPKNCRCSVVRTYVQRGRLYKYALTPIPREICNEPAAPVQGGRAQRGQLVSSPTCAFSFPLPPSPHALLVTHVVGRLSPRMKIMVRLSLTNSWLIVVLGSLSCDRWEIRGAELTLRRGRMIFFFFFFTNLDVMMINISISRIF